MAPSTIEQTFQLAVQHHQSGRLPQAEALYRQILAARPDHADALHLMGLLASQYRQPDVAIELMLKAIALQPHVADYHVNLGNTYQVKGRPDDAIASYQRALELNPGMAEVHSNLGIVLHAQGRSDEAIECHRRAIAHKPKYAEAHNNLGNVYRDLRRLDEAVACYEQSVALKPNYAKALSNLGAVYVDLEREDEALALHERAVALAPNSAEAHCNHGNALRAKGRLEEAVAAHRRALALNPNLPEAHNNLGAALHELARFDEAIASCEHALQLRPRYPNALVNLIAALDHKGRIDEAIECYRRAVEIEPNLAAAHNNFSVALCRAGRYEEACECARKVLELNPDSAEAHSHLGLPLGQLGRVDEAIACYERAIALKPDFAQAHFNLALMLLLRGDFARGWAENEWRWKVKDVSRMRRAIKEPQWDGSPLAGRSLYLHCEWGFGDTLQYIRYASLVKGGRVIVECQKELMRLLRQSVANCIWITENDPLPAIDVHCGMASLPMIFQTTAANVPGRLPYLRASEKEIQTWKTRLAGDLQPLRVGLVWAGNKSHKNDRNRSMKLATLAPLKDVPGVSLYSLQMGEAAEQMKDPRIGLRLVDWTHQAHDFADSAGLIANLDLVISVDTSIVHLAGAMGKPVWTMLPLAPDWRWLLGRDDSPWYPSMRLFRQPKVGDWASVVKNVVEALRDFPRRGSIATAPLSPGTPGERGRG